jgi:hypothetical protein
MLTFVRKYFCLKKIKTKMVSELKFFVFNSTLKYICFGSCSQQRYYFFISQRFFLVDRKRALQMKFQMVE